MLSQSHREQTLSKIIKLIFISFALPILCGCASLQFASNNEKYTPKLPNYNSPNVALVLGSGGAKGLAHVAVLEELERAGIKPDLIVGCSAGSIVGAMYADGMELSQIRQVLLNGKRETFIDFSLSNLPFGLFGGDSLNKFLHTNIKTKNIEDLKIPFIAVATNLQYGDLAAFGYGDLIQALKSSAAYPGAFYPVKINGNYFVDGGVANPVPVEVAKQAGAKYIIAVDISEDLTSNKPRNFVGVIKRSFDISYLHQSRLALLDADFVIDMPFADIGTFEDSKNKIIYHVGKKSAQKYVPIIKQQLTSISSTHKAVS